MKRLTIKTLAALTTFGVVMAMAASLGGVTSDGLGAEDSTVAACDTNGVDTAFATTWDSTDKRYETPTVNVQNVADTCDGQTLNVTVTDSTGASLAAGTLTIPTSGAVDHTVTLGSAVSTESLSGVHVTIS